MERKYKNILMLSADSPEQLRGIDVWRVMSAASDANCFIGFAEWLQSQPINDRARLEVNTYIKAIEAEKAQPASRA